MKRTMFRAPYLVQWNAKMGVDDTKPLVDKVVEAVLHHQGIPFEHSSEYRNIYSYDKLVEQLEHYEPELKVNTLDGYLTAGLNQAFRIFSKPKTMDTLKTVSLTQEAKVLFQSLKIRETTSAGLTAYGESKLSAFTTGLDKAVRILTEAKSPAPCLAGVRTQRKGKTRLVWMYPLEMTIIEAITARPLIETFLSREHVMTFGDHSHEIGMRFRKSISMNKYHYSLDYSQFDASITAEIINYAFSAFATWFDLSQEVLPDVTLGHIFDLVRKYFVFTPIVMPCKGLKYPELVTGKRQGVPSGSYFTQLVDSFCNVALIMSANQRFKLGIRDDDLYVLGDDCLFFCNSLISVKQIGVFVSTYGFKVNNSKGSHGLATEMVEYLGRRWKNGFPLRLYTELTRGALYPEKYRKYSPENGQRYTQALNVLNSYLLTSYVEDAPVGLGRFCRTNFIESEFTTGFTKYLINEGLIPGKVLKRAIY